MNNSKPLLVASFLTLIAAGVGFAIRGVILEEWATAFGFTKGELGTITGGGLTGFGITIIICSLIVDKVGYKPLMVLAFVLHVLSAVVTIAAGFVFAINQSKNEAYWCLYIGTFMFALGNGVCEAVINPLVATLYPKQKTHYLNILHAGWPGGLILGGLLAYLFVGRDAAIRHLPWEIPIAFFLVPTLLYGIMALKEKFPVSEASAAGVSYGEMLSVFASPILLLLLLLHAMVGYVELGTDSWITDILKNTEPNWAALLFVYASALMFALRFFAGPIVERINPLGLLLLSSLLGCVGLYWLGSSGGAAIIGAYTIYGIGKTFLWPTMLGVVGERFPKGGALVMGAMGGVGTISAGLLGGPGIGYKQDYYAAQYLREKSPDTYQRYVSKARYSMALNQFVEESEKKDGEWPIRFGEVVMKEKTYAFLEFTGIFPKIAGLDGQKVGKLEDKVKLIEKLKSRKESIPPEDELTVEEEKDYGPVHEASIYGGQMALKWTALVPAGMAVGYLLLVLYFRMTGGYKVEELKGRP
jgi:MFS family permease